VACPRSTTSGIVGNRLAGIQRAPAPRRPAARGEGTGWPGFNGPRRPAARGDCNGRKRARTNPDGGFPERLRASVPHRRRDPVRKPPGGTTGILDAALPV